MNTGKPSLAVIEPDWPVPDNVKAFFTLRTGGVSAGKYGGADGFNGLNLGAHVGDSPYCVKANRRMVESMGCGSIKWLNQVHSTRAVEADGIGDEPCDADASFTVSNNVACVVMTADCLPVLVSGTKGEIVGAIHAGWKGLVDGVIREAIDAMRRKAGDGVELMAWLGPRIGERDFVVQEDVRALYRKSALGAKADEFIVPCPEGFLLNLAGFAKLALEQAGVTKVYDCGLSTYADGQRFYSYRRDKVTGRHGAIIYKY